MDDIDNKDGLRWKHKRPTIVTQSYCQELKQHLEKMRQPSLGDGQSASHAILPCSSTWHLMDASAGAKHEVFENDQQLMG